MSQRNDRKTTFAIAAGATLAAAGVAALLYRVLTRSTGQSAAATATAASVASPASTSADDDVASVASPAAVSEALQALRGRWLIVVNSRTSPAGLVDPFLRSQGCEVETVLLDDGAGSERDRKLPAFAPATPADAELVAEFCDAGVRGALADYVGVVVLGGPMGVYDVSLCPWLRAEMALIRAADARGLPVLGVCLGAQLMAQALGGRAYKSPVAAEAGLITLRAPSAATCALDANVAASSAAAAGPTDAAWVFAPLIAGGLPFISHHGDTFDVPAGARVLAETGALGPDADAEPPARYRQAFACAAPSQCVGVQFHPEAVPSTLERWVRTDLACGAESRFVQGAGGEDALAARAQHATDERDAIADAGEAFFERWWMHLVATRARATDLKAAKEA